VNDDERFETICGPAFKRIEDGNAKILESIRGTEERPGLTERLRRVEDELVEQAKVVRDHHHILFGEGRDKSGLVDDMRQQQKRQERASRLAWTAITAAVGQIGIWIAKAWSGGGQ
jgi:hypothetical protein